MRAKKIYEAFVEDSDPIKDMGIGDPFSVGDIIRNKVEKDVFEWYSNSKGGGRLCKIKFDPLNTLPEYNKVFGIILDKKYVEDNKIQMYIAFFGNKYEIKDRIIPNLQKKISFFTNILGVNVSIGTYSLSEWKKYLEKRSVKDLERK